MVYPLLLIVGGLPKSGKTESLKKTFGLLSDGTFSHHELVCSGLKRQQKIQTRSVKRYEGFKYSILSALKYHHTSFKLGRKLTAFTDEQVDDYMNKMSSFLQYHFNEDSAFEKGLNGGIGIANIWDLTVNQSKIRSLLESFGVCFTRSHMWLYINLERDAKHLHLPPEFEDMETKLEQLRSRIQYLFRTCLMSRRSNLGKKKCNILATYTANEIQTDEKNRKIEKLKRECENAAEQMGIKSLIDFNIVEVDLSSPEKSLTRCMRSIFMQTESKNEIPISWLFFCGSFSNHTKFCMTVEQLKQKAKQCDILQGQGDLKEFCELFTSFGSIIDVRLVDEKSQYIIVKPFEFLKAFSCLSNKHKDGIVLMSSVSKENRVIMEILVSVNYAVKLSEKYFVPSFQQGDAIRECNQEAVQLTLGIGAPHVNMQIEILKHLIEETREDFTACLKFNASNKYTNSMLIQTTDVQGRVVEIQLISQGSVMEICFSSEYEYAKEIIKIRCIEITKAVAKIMKKKSVMFDCNFEYQFALRCEGDTFDPEIAFNAHRKRHIFPSERLCSKCKVKKGDRVLQIVSAWNEALKEVNIMVVDYIF